MSFDLPGTPWLDAILRLQPWPWQVISNTVFWLVTHFSCVKKNKHIFSSKISMIYYSFFLFRNIELQTWYTARPKSVYRMLRHTRCIRHTSASQRLLAHCGAVRIGEWRPTDPADAVVLYSQTWYLNRVITRHARDNRRMLQPQLCGSTRSVLAYLRVITRQACDGRRMLQLHYLSFLRRPISSKCVGISVAAAVSTYLYAFSILLSLWLAAPSRHGMQ